MDINTEILHQFKAAILIINKNGKIIFANNQFVQKSGYSGTDLIGEKAFNLITDFDLIAENMQGVTYIKTKSGAEIPNWIEINQLNEANEMGLIFSNIQMGGIDPLTLLPNRYLLSNHIQNAIKMAKEQSTIFAVFYIDLDRFKFINDTLGHTYGDLLLKEVSFRLKNCAGRGNIVARMGGDEFIFLVQDLQHEAEVDFKGKEILSLFKEPFQLIETEFHISPSIGVSIYPYDGDDFETLMINADTAMYRAKKNGRSKIERTNVEITAGSFEKLMIENSLRSALGKGELHLHFQPQIDLEDGDIMGMEALLRWEHPEFGNIPPSEFIPIAEESSLILPIGEWVIRKSCLKIKEWLDAGNQNVRVAVNLSAKQFLQNDLADKIQQVLKEYSIPSMCLELEITESMMMYDIDSAADILNRLKKLGVHITIDDFGKGYSSLQYLQKLPLDTLKIDRSFIADIDSNASSRALTNAITNLAHALDMKVIAEGVETVRQLEQVQTLKCDGVQGFYYSKPLSPEEADHFIHKHKGERNYV